jgi:tetratricopeptide (TPR) repeat protein
MSKMVIVPLPFVLLLLDYWPLNRFNNFSSDLHSKNDAQISKIPKMSDRTGDFIHRGFKLFIEKIPLIAVSIISTLLGVIGAHHLGGVITSVESLSIKLRIISTITFYLKYILNMFYPFNLSAIYLHPGKYPELFSSPAFPWWETTGALTILALISFMAVKVMKRMPYFIVGWLWFLGTLIPVIGLIQIGRHSIADRYSYIPHIGLFIIIAWGIPELLSRWRHKKVFLSATVFTLLSILTITTCKQLTYWKNSITLFKHAVKVNPNNFVAHINLGSALDSIGRNSEATKHFLEAVRLVPNIPKARNNLGLSLDKQGNSDEAIKHLLKAIQLSPDYVDAHYNLSNALHKVGRTDEAIGHLLKTIHLKPDYAEAHNNLGNALLSDGRTDEAIHYYNQALKLKTDYAEAHNNLGTALDSKGLTEKALKHFSKAIEIKPDFAEAYNNMGKALYKEGLLKEAINNFLKSIEINPGLAEAHNNLGIAYIGKENIDAAIVSFQKALLIKPSYANAKLNLKKALLIQYEE